MGGPGASADEHRECGEGLDGKLHLCHIFRREAPAPAMLHALKLWADPLTGASMAELGGSSKRKLELS